MKEIIYDVVVAALILSLLLIAFRLYRGNMQVIDNSAKKVEETNMVTSAVVSVDDNGEPLSVASGLEVSKVLRYYTQMSSTEAVDVIVRGVKYNKNNKPSETMLNEISSRTSYTQTVSDDGKTITYN